MSLSAAFGTVDFVGAAGPLWSFLGSSSAVALVLLSGFAYDDFTWWFGPDCLGHPVGPPAPPRPPKRGLHPNREPIAAERPMTRPLTDGPKPRPQPRPAPPRPGPRPFTGGWAVPEMPPGYEGFRLVGSGGFADVFYAERKRDGRPVAIKRLRRAAGHAELAEKLFRREVDLLARLRHRAFPRLYSRHLEGEHPYFIMEFIDGVNLSQRIRDRGAVTSRRAAIVLGLSVSDALAELHRMRIMHRDLTPANIMIAQSKVRVIDLGVSKDLDSQSTPSNVKPGTLGFYAPEYLVETVSKPTMDVFSWGASMGYALTGRKPYGEALNHEQLLQRVLDGKLDGKFLEELARVGGKDRIFSRMELIIRRCLRADPSGRPQDGGALSAMIEPLVEWYRKDRSS